MSCGVQTCHAYQLYAHHADAPYLNIYILVALVFDDISEPNRPNSQSGIKQSQFEWNQINLPYAVAELKIHKKFPNKEKSSSFSFSSFTKCNEHYIDFFCIIGFFRKKSKITDVYSLWSFKHFFLNYWFLRFSINRERWHYFVVVVTGFWRKPLGMRRNVCFWVYAAGLCNGHWKFSCLGCTFCPLFGYIQSLYVRNPQGNFSSVRDAFFVQSQSLNWDCSPWKGF